MVELDGDRHCTGRPVSMSQLTPSSPHRTSRPTACEYGNTHAALRAWLSPAYRTRQSDRTSVLSLLFLLAFLMSRDETLGHVYHQVPCHMVILSERYGWHVHRSASRAPQCGGCIHSDDPWA